MDELIYIFVSKLLYHLLFNLILLIIGQSKKHYTFNMSIPFDTLQSFYEKAKIKLKTLPQRLSIR